MRSCLCSSGHHAWHYDDDDDDVIGQQGRQAQLRLCLEAVRSPYRLKIQIQELWVHKGEMSP